MGLTGVAAFLYAGFQALAAVPQILAQVEAFAGAVMAWYVQRQSAETQAAISDALALGMRAKTTEDRYAVAKAWRDAISRPRVSVG